MLDILRNSTDINISALKKEKDYSFVECAIFADSIKGRRSGFNFQANWHFMNTPYLDEDQNIDKYDFKGY